MTPSTVTLLIETALHAAGLRTARVVTVLDPKGYQFVTTVVGANTRDVAMVLRGYHGRAYGTSVEVVGGTVISRQLNK